MFTIGLSCALFRTPAEIATPRIGWSFTETPTSSSWTRSRLPRGLDIVQCEQTQTQTKVIVI